MKLPTDTTPPGPVSTMGTAEPDEPVGVKATMDVFEATVNDDAAFEPKATADVPKKPLPVIVTAVAPLEGPVVGEIAVTVGEYK